MLRIKLSRRGKKKQPIYRIIVTEKSKDPWGDYLENVGTWNPRTEPNSLELKEDRVKHWLSVGAQPTDTVHNLLVDAGIIKEKKVRASNLGKKYKEKVKAEAEAAKEAAQKAKEEAEAPKEEAAPEGEAPAPEEAKADTPAAEEKPAEEAKPDEEKKESDSASDEAAKDKEEKSE